MLVVRTGINSAIVGTSSNDGTYTDNNGNYVQKIPSVQDKIVAFSSIVFGVVGFLVFICYYCTPLIRAQRNARRETAKRRRKISLPFLTDHERLSNIASTLSKLNGEKSPEPERSRRFLARDSIQVAKHRQESAFLDLIPFLSRFPTPPEDQMITTPACVYPCPSLVCVCQSRSLGSPPSSSPTCPHGASEQEYTSPRVAPHPNPGQTLLQPVLPTTANTKSQEVPMVVGARDILSEGPNLSYGCGSNPPRPSKLGSLFSACSLPLRVGGRTVAKLCKPGHPSNSGISRPTKRAYPNTDLPRYADASFRSPSSTQLQFLASNHHDSQNSVGFPQSQPSEGSTTRIPRIQSLHMNDSVFARASAYARGLISGTAAHPKARTGTDLQFEIVKESGSVVF